MTGMAKNKVLQAGAKFNSLTFIRYTPSAHGNAYGIFRCEFCGECRERVVSHVRTGYVKFCHCQTVVRATRHGHAGAGRESPTYEAWSAMKKRCLNPKHASFSDYGGRGIQVCERWMTFENFLADMGERPAGMSLERTNNALGYFRGNCEWAGAQQQNNNRRSNTVLQFGGRSMTIAQWSRETGIKDCTLSERLRKGWDVSRALTTPTRKYAGHENVPPALS